MVTWGANTTATFTPGTTPGAAPAAPAPAAAGGFSFGGGAAAPSTPTIGSTPAPPPPPPPPPAFGASSAFGAPAPAPAAGGFFGSTPAPAAPAPAATGFGGFGIGTTPAPAAGGFGAGLFGGSTAAPATTGFGGFGTTPAAAAPSTGFSGGTPAAATTAAPAPFGSPAPAAQAAMAHITATRRQEAARLEGALLSLHAQYSPTVAGPTLIGTTPHHAQVPSSQCRFQYVFYDPMTPEQRQQRLVHGPHHPPPRPSHVDGRTWADAVARNPDPDEYIPVVTVGAEALATRLSSQKERSTKLAGYATQLRDALSTLGVQADKSDDAVRAAQIEHGKLRSRLLRLMRRVEILRCTNLPLQPAEREAAERVGAVRVGVDKVGRALAEVEERGRHHVHALRTMAATGGGGGSAAYELGNVVLSEHGRADLHYLLVKQKDGLDQLSAIVARDSRDAKIAKEEFGGGDGGGGGMGTAPGIGQRSPAFAGTYRAY